ncbi:MAG TPA: hypothetical protein VLK82_24120 [Candidatus Tectomicrobia bacterium]|nr:hypothetical protein [Candidatus Tectomicrobia bacterium]
MADLRGLLSPVERKNSWQVAEARGKLAGDVQRRPWPHLPLSVPEMRRLIRRLALATQHTACHILV